MKKIFLSPERRPAPHGRYWGMDVYEHNVCCEIADRLKILLERSGFEVYTAPPSWTMEQRASYANRNRFDYYLCIHTNAAGNGSKEGTATGAECLYYNHPASIKANRLVYDELTALYPSSRGCKDYSSFYENANTTMVSCYPEIAFHDNGRDARWITGHKAEISAALCRGVCGYFGMTPAEQPTECTDTCYTAEQYNSLLAEKNAATELANALADKLEQIREIVGKEKEEV